MFNKFKSESGFTITRLLMGLVLAAVLLAVTVPTYLSHQRRMLEISIKTEVIAASPFVAQWMIGDVASKDPADAPLKGYPHTEFDIHRLNDGYTWVIIGTPKDSKMDFRYCYNSTTIKYGSDDVTCGTGASVITDISNK